MAGKAKEARSYVKLVSTASAHCYYVSKNRNNVKDRLQLKKYDPIVRKHVLYKEGK
jgi:large subunit ribosomal protein L33